MPGRTARALGYQRRRRGLPWAATASQLCGAPGGATDVLQHRIRQRRIPYERQIGRDYINALNAAYNYFFFHYSETPLLVVKTDDIDFVKRPEHFEDLMNQISRPVEGKQYYVPAP